MAKVSKPDQDLTQTDPDVDDSNIATPTSPTGETFEINWKSRIIGSAVAVLLIAIPAHFFLAVSGVPALLTSALIVVVLTHPELSPRMLKQMSTLARKLKSK